MNGEPGAGGGSTGWTCAATLTLTVRCRAYSCGVDHLHYPQRQPAVLVSLLDRPVTGWTGRSPAPSRCPGRVRAIGEHHPELDRDRTLKCHWQLLVIRRSLRDRRVLYFSTRLEKISLV